MESAQCKTNSIRTQMHLNVYIFPLYLLEKELFKLFKLFKWLRQGYE